MPTATPRRSRPARAAASSSASSAPADVAPDALPVSDSRPPPKARRPRAQSAAAPEPAPVAAPAPAAKRRRTPVPAVAEVEVPAVPVAAARKSATPAAPRKAAARKTAAKAVTAVTAAAPAPVAKPAAAPAPAKTEVVQKAAPKKTVAKKAAVKTTATEKVAVKKVAVKKAAAETVVAETVAAETAIPNQGPAETGAAKKVVAKKVAAKKAAPRTEAAKKAAVASAPAPEVPPVAPPTPAKPTPEPKAKASRKSAARAANAAVEAEVTEPQVQAPVPAPVPAPTEGPASKRRRRSAAQPVVEPAAEPVIEPAVEAPPAVAEAPVAEAPAPVPALRARGRRKSGAAEPEVVPVDAVAPEPEPVAAPSRRRRRKEAPVEASASAPAEAVTAVPVEGGGEPEPTLNPHPVSAAAGDEAPEAPPASRSSRRRRRKSAGALAALAETAGDDAEVGEAVPAAADAEAPPAPVAEPEPEPEPLPPLPAWPQADLDGCVTEPVDPAAPFGPHRVTERRSGAVHLVQLRGLAVGDNDCDCADFARSDDAACPHLHSLLAAQVQHGGALHAALLAAEAPAHSELQLRYGVERQVVWRPGSACPTELRELAASLLDEQGRLRSGDAAAVQRLQRRAAELGHRLDVTDAVWRQVGEQHDAQRRLLALEAAYPAGPADATLQHGLLRHPLAAHQVEAALLAASIGRCVLADEAGLGKIAQALATLALLRRHFGAERLLIVTPPELLRRWHRAVARWGNVPARHGLDDLADGSAAPSAPVLRIVGLDELRQKIDLVAAWAPDALVLDEGALDEAPWLGRSGAQLARLDPAATLVITRRRLDNRPEALEALVRWLDPLRGGATRRLLAHRREEGADIGHTLLPLLIARQRPSGSVAGAELALPHAVGDDVHTLALSPAQAARHQQGRAQALRLVERWERIGDLSSREQRELLGAVQGMRRSCAADDGEADPKTTALLALIDELGAHDPAPRLVVCSQWASALQPLAQALAARGVEALDFDAGLDDAVLADRAARFATEPACRVALVADAVLPRLHLDHADAGLVHLDRPWDPGRLAQRLCCVLPADAPGEAQAAAAAVPVLHLIAESSLEEALLDQQTSLAAAGGEPDAAEVARLLDHPAAGAFLAGSALARLVQQLREVLQAI